MVEVLAIPVVVGRKPPGERFPGAINSMTCEGMMGDGKALQMGTSHELGQNFARIFDIGYLDDTGQQQLAWTTSWGTSTRMVGGLIMGHGDDRGLVVPPGARRRAGRRARSSRTRTAPATPAAGSPTSSPPPASASSSTTRWPTGFGRRATDWELKGVPVRIEVGPRDLADGQVTLVRRDTGDEDAASPSPRSPARVPALLDEIQASMLDRATKRRDERIAEVDDLDDAAEACRTGWAKLPWDLVQGDGETRLANDAVVGALPPARRRLRARRRRRARPRRLRRPQLLVR